MIQLFREAYSTYVDTALKRPERHALRLTISLGMSLAFAFFVSNKVSDAYSIMATGVTVLTGFTFTALFSDNAVPSSGLPSPKNESDRHDRVLLETLSRNFRLRSYYFIAISILETVILVAASFQFELPSALHSWLHEVAWAKAIYSLGWFPAAKKAFLGLPIILGVVIIFIYLECLYTFYRMAETVMAILDIKRNYLEMRDESKR